MAGEKKEYHITVSCHDRCETLVYQVVDDGQGMDEKTQEQIFEPFFTTKGDKGNGLGLATVYGIVKQHDGNIWVYSEVGSGTTIRVYLPVIEDNVEVEHETILTDPENFYGDETILLVEDNAQVRSLAQTILEQQGYTVIAAADGDDALSKLEKHHDTIDLLLTDVVLPNLNGKEIYELAVQKHPRLMVLYMSGYTNNVIAHRGVLDEGVNFIQKPFSVNTLGLKIRQILNRAVAHHKPCQL